MPDANAIACHNNERNCIKLLETRQQQFHHQHQTKTIDSIWYNTIFHTFIDFIETFKSFIHSWTDGLILDTRF